MQARSGTPAQPDQHRRPAQHDHAIAGIERFLFGLAINHQAGTTGQHDRLVIAPKPAIDRLAEAAEIAKQIRTAELIIEARRTDRPFQHDLQRAGLTLGRARHGFPVVLEFRNAQIGNAETGQSGHRTTTATRRRFIANLTAGTRRRARIRRDCGGVIMRFDLDLNMLQCVGFAPGRLFILAGQQRA